MKKIVAAVVSFVALASANAQAVGPDLSGMTGAIDWSTTTAAVLTIAGGLAGVYVVVKATQLVLARIKRG